MGMQILAHETMTVCTVSNTISHPAYPTWRVSTKLYQLQHVTTCKFSLKRHVSAPFWRTRMCPWPYPYVNVC